VATLHWSIPGPPTRRRPRACCCVTPTPRCTAPRRPAGTASARPRRRHGGRGAAFVDPSEGRLIQSFRAREAPAPERFASPRRRWRRSPEFEDGHDDDPPLLDPRRPERGPRRALPAHPGRWLPPGPGHREEPRRVAPRRGPRRRHARSVRALLDQPDRLQPSEDGESRVRRAHLPPALNKPANSDVYTAYMAEFIETFSRIVPEKFRRTSSSSRAVPWRSRTPSRPRSTGRCRKNLAAGRGELGTRILHFRQAFHGRSGYTLSLTNTADPRKTSTSQVRLAARGQPQAALPGHPGGARRGRGARAAGRRRDRGGGGEVPARHRGPHHRAHPGRGRRQSLPRRVPARAARPRRPPRLPAHLRRGPDRLRHHGQVVAFEHFESSPTSSPSPRRRRSAASPPAAHRRGGLGVQVSSRINSTWAATWWTWCAASASSRSSRRTACSTTPRASARTCSPACAAWRRPSRARSPTRAGAPLRGLRPARRRDPRPRAAGAQRGRRARPRLGRARDPHAPAAVISIAEADEGLRGSRSAGAFFA